MPPNILARIGSLCSDVSSDRLIELGLGSSEALLTISRVSTKHRQAAIKTARFVVTRQYKGFSVIKNVHDTRTRMLLDDERVLREWTRIDGKSCMYALFMRVQHALLKTPQKKRHPPTFAPRRPSRDIHRIVLGRWRTYADNEEVAVFDPYASRSTAHHFKIVLVPYHDVRIEISLLQSPSFSFSSSNSSSPQRIGGYFKAKKRKRANVQHTWSKVPDAKRASLFQSSHHRPRSSLFVSHVVSGRSTKLDFEPLADTFKPVSVAGESMLLDLKAGEESVLCLRLDPRLRDRKCDREFQIQLSYHRRSLLAYHHDEKPPTTTKTLTSRRITLPSLDRWTSFDTSSTSSSDVVKTTA